MIAYIKGKVADLQDGILILDCGHVGVQLLITGRDAARMPSTGKEVMLWTHLSIAEDAWTLYGFLDKEDLNMYRLLLKVSGVGPKAALGVMSAFSADELRITIIADDAKTLSKAPGIGAKTAKKIMLELKDKIDAGDALKSLSGGDMEGVPSTGGSLGDPAAEAVEALAALGYPAAEALKAVRKVPVTEDWDTEMILKQALKHLI